MKFDCGETEDEKHTRLSNWHKFFAIWPRRVGVHDCRWLETIERRGSSYTGGFYETLWIWTYRAIEG